MYFTLLECLRLYVWVRIIVYIMTSPHNNDNGDVEKGEDSDAGILCEAKANDIYAMCTIQLQCCISVGVQNLQDLFNTTSQPMTIIKGLTE